MSYWLRGAAGLGVGVFWLIRRLLLPPLRPRPGGNGTPRRVRGPNRARLLGNLLLAVGACLLALAVVAYFSDLLAPRTVLPRPVALAGDAGGVTLAPPVAEAPTSTPVPSPTRQPVSALGADATSTSIAVDIGTPTLRATATATPMPTLVPTRTPSPTATPTAVRPGVPVRVEIPAIGVDSRVKPAGTYWANGELQWETLPYVVAHYGTTAKAGERGNAVFSGHVTSRSAGNVFADLYQVQLGDEVHIFTEDARFVYVVTGVREVLPTEISVMNPTTDATATLITCSGEWIPSRREFTHRLIVTAKLRA